MFSKILIANRGEIAVRVIRTARRMGIATVAVYSDADRDALHVQMADEAVAIGPAPAAQSYLVAERIIAAAKRTGAEAVHPGYGFLSERAAFCAALESEGIVFIGPKVRAIEAMGDKITSKKLAAEAGISIVPGHMGLVADADEAAEIAAAIGFPVMIKASAGGGGKGMRIARTQAEAREGFARSRSEAAASFGDDRIFIERYVEDPRHIEIQVLADAHGACLHLGERECSIQRRNQKVVEEAPSPFLDAATRKAMGAQAVALAKAVDYQSAGTVEFIVDRDRNFFFLEMNTRLQVEHPVTELVTGLDLVEQMIRVAAGEPLSFGQEDVRMDGWAIESRIYAEDPFRGFLPSIGQLTRYRPPAEGPTDDGAIVRNDAGVAEGSEVSMFYDPMISKLCTWAPTRRKAIDAMADALDATVIEGIQPNVPFLQALMQHPRFREGRLSTGFIAEEYPDGFQRPLPDAAEVERFAAVAAALERIAHRRPLGAGADRFARTARSHTEANGAVRRSVVVDGRTVAVAIAGPKHAPSVAIGDGAPIALRIDWQPGEPLARVDGFDVPWTVRVARVIGGWRLARRGVAVTAKVYSPRVAELAALMPEKAAPDTSRLLLCPMPGLVVAVVVREGDTVEEGQALAIVEAMKMENTLRAERKATIARVAVKPGDSLAVDQVMMEFAP